MGIFRTNNPLQYDEVDGIVIDETAPSPSIKGVGTGVAILMGQFERGPLTLQSMGSSAEILETYGKSDVFLGSIALKNKKFSALKIARVVASDAVAATLTFDDGAATDIIKFDAKFKGVYGNSIKVTIEAGSVSGRKYTVQDTSLNTQLDVEVYDNIEIANVVLSTFSESKMVDVTVLATSAEPANSVATALATGAEGTLADTDYETAIALASAEGAGNVLFLDEYNATRNGYLKAHAALTEDKMVICAGAEGDSVATAIAAVATLRDTAGRIIYAFNWVETSIGGVNTFTSPASWYASIFSQIGPHIDPAYQANSQFLFGVIGLKQTLTRANFIALMEDGISSFEFDSDVGFKIKSGVVTQILNSSKLTVLRRRMADYLTNSIGKFLKVYQNDINSLLNRTAVKASILDFDKGQVDLGIVPSSAEVNGGDAVLVDIETLNTDATIAQGKFFIQFKRRIFSSMRFIVLKAEIGESVVVTEGE